MDPFIEASSLWEDFHAHLIDNIGDSLADRVPERYLVRTGERSYVALVKEQGKESRPFLPDVSITATRGREKTTKKGGTALAELDSEIEPVQLCRIRPLLVLCVTSILLMANGAKAECSAQDKRRSLPGVRLRAPPTRHLRNRPLDQHWAGRLKRHQEPMAAEPRRHQALER